MISNKKIIWTILCLMFILLFSACGRVENDLYEVPYEEMRSNTERNTSEIWQDERIELSGQYEKIFVKDNIIYGYYTNSNEMMLVSQDAYTGEVLREIVLSNMSNVNNITADEKGNVFIADDNGFWKIDGNGDIGFVGNFELEDLDKAQSVYPKSIFIDYEGNFYLWYEMGLPSSLFYESEYEDTYTMADRIYIKDNELNTLFYVQIQNSKGIRILSVDFNENGVPIVLIQTPEGIEVAEVSFDKHELTTRMLLEEADFFESSKIALTENGFIFCKENNLYQYDYQLQEQWKLLELPSYGILAEDIIYLGMKGEKIEIIDNYSDNENSEYVVISEGEEVKTNITLGVMQMSKELENIVADYNRFSTEAKVQLVEYYLDGDVDEGIKRLKLDIISGNAPDIINISMINADIFSDKGAFVDLYKFMETDDQLSKEMLVESVRKAYESDGHLYSMGAAFQLHTIWGAGNVIQDRSGVSMGELVEMLERNGKTINAVYGFSADEPVLTTLCTFAMDEFIDWKSTECNFTGDYMKGLMDFSANYKGYEGSLSRGIAEREILLSIGQIDSVADYQIQKELYGGDIFFVGYPTSKGTGTAISIRGGELAINAKSSNPDLAWDFVKYFILNGYMGEGFPTQKECLAIAMQEAMLDEYIDTEIIPKQTFWEGEKMLAAAYAASQGEVDAVLRLIEGADTRYKYNVDIQNIINEEAESYFYGQKDFQAVAEIIENRVGIYLEEHMK